MVKLYHILFFVQGVSGTPSRGVIDKSELINTVEKHSGGWGVFWKMGGYLCRLKSKGGAGLLTENLGGGGAPIPCQTLHFQPF